MPNENAPPGRSLDVRLPDLQSLLRAELVSAGDSELRVTGVQDDSRRVVAGDVFVAVVGLSVDGHDFAQAAIERGACALVVEHKLNFDIPQLLVNDASHSLGILAAHMAGRPADRLTNIGITGTNGKTTTTYLVESILQTAGQSPGVLGTVSYRFNGKERPAPYTTPTPLVLQEAFLAMESEGCDISILEVSSAALHMDRLVGTSFQVAAFSNLSQDHLDVHNTMEEYRDAKARLFRDHLQPGGVAVVNVDDDTGAFMAGVAKGVKGANVLRVSRNPNTDAEVRVLSYRSSVEGLFAEIATPRGTLQIECDSLIGHYNMDNIALAVGIGEALKLKHVDIAQGIASMDGVPGRVQRVANNAGIDIFVDYAHTPDALVNVLSALRPLTKGRLLCVFGCGGDRDPGKRPLMGAAVAENADLAFVTSDNPRTEDPQAIVDAINVAVPDAFFVDVDRRTAILAAILEATPGDVVLIAGKGHEDYQIVGTEKLHFDDREEAAGACNEREPIVSLRTVLQVTSGELLSESEDTKDQNFNRVIIDGRSAATGDLYVAIVGERVDGHDYCEQAVLAGASGVIVARGRGANLSGIVIEVDDPRVALGQIARTHRNAWNGKVIGVTGSAGKTTTKDLIAAALKSSGRVHAATGSNNNETGVPLTLLGLRPYHDFAVVEMGMRALGEIDYLAKIALPDVALVINAGSAHLGELGSIENIAKAKGEIFAKTGESGPIAIYPADDERLAALATQAESALSFGDSSSDNTCSASLCLESYKALGPLGSELSLTFGQEQVSATIPLIGKHNATNACAALLVASAAGADIVKAAQSIAAVKVPRLRGEISTIAGRHLYVDCYNANPASMKAALLAVSELRGEKKAFAVLGDMLELGEDSAKCHVEAGELAARLGIPVLALGEFRDDIVSGANAAQGVAWPAESPKAAARAILASTSPGDWVLLKASRGMKLERVAEAMRTESDNKQ